MSALAYAPPPLPPTFSFVDETHTYYLRGEAIPGYSDVIRLTGRGTDYSKLSPFVMEKVENARKRGQAVDLATHYFDENDLDIDTLPEEIARYLFGWICFRDDYGFTPELIQYSGCKDGELPFGFTLDRVGTMRNRERWLIDMKCTYSVAPYWPLQTASYSDGLDDLTLKRGVVWLKKDGTYKLLPHTNDLDYEQWRDALKEAHELLANGTPLKQ